VNEMYPMRFEPIDQNPLWGGRRLAGSLSAPLPGMVLSPQLGCSAIATTLRAGRDGTVANVVFPAGFDRRDGPGSPDRFDVSCWMGERRIGVTRPDLPDFLP